MVLTELRPAAPMADICPIRARLARIHEGVEFPALSKQIIDMFSSLDDDAHSLQRLTNVVLREYSLTLGGVKTANSVTYRRGARPNQSGTHAMMLLGARTGRQLGSGLLLVENYARQS
ncbi:MAG: HDOD domain-containing protein, partial [Gemmatimonas sp.]